jgi:hypothetical protein
MMTPQAQGAWMEAHGVGQQPQEGRGVGQTRTPTRELPSENKSQAIASIQSAQDINALRQFLLDAEKAGQLLDENFEFTDPDIRAEFERRERALMGEPILDPSMTRGYAGHPADPAIPAQQPGPGLKPFIRRLKEAVY